MRKTHDVSATATAGMGDAYLKYVDALKPYLLSSLRNHAEYQVCVAAVGVVGDLCRALSAAMTPHLDEIMLILLDTLGVPPPPTAPTAPTAPTPALPLHTCLASSLASPPPSAAAAALRSTLVGFWLLGY